MRGHSAAIDMRRQGFTPRMVFIDLGDASDWPSLWPANCPHRAHVEIDDDEPISGLDFRFCVGLKVVVQGKDMARVRLVSEACLEAGAGEVTAVDHLGNMEHRIAVEAK